MAVKAPYLPISKFSREEFIKDKLPSIEKINAECDVADFFSDLPSNATSLGREKFSKDVALLLYGMEMDKYIDIFKSEDVNLETFMELTVEDLEALGVTESSDQDAIVNSLNMNGKQPVNKLMKPKIDPQEDLLIAKNILRHIALLEKYASYTLLQLKKGKFTDYFVSRNKTAVGILELLSAKATLQAKRLLGGFTNGEPESGIIQTAVEAEKVTAPEMLLKKLVQRVTMKPHEKMVLRVVAVAGLSTMFFFIANQFVKYKH